MSWTGAIAAGISAASKLLSAGGDQYSSSKAYRRSVNTAQHAHQWEVGDLRAAGLNPILSATGGSGASAQAFQAAPMDLDPTAGLSRGAQAEVNRAQVENVQADTRLKDTQSEYNVFNSAKALQEIQEVQERIENFRVQRGLVQAQTAAGLASAFEGLQRAGTFGSVVQMNRAHAAQLHAAGFEAYQRGLLSRQEYSYFDRHPEELPIKLLRLSGSNPLLYAKGLQQVFGGGTSARSESRSPSRRTNIDPYRFDNFGSK